MPKTFNEILKTFNKEAFINDYSVELLSTTQLCKKYNVCLSTLNKIINELNLSRDTHAVKSKSNSEVKSRLFNQIIEKISYDDLYQYYIAENHSYEEAINYFNLKASTFDKLLRHHDIKKDRSKSFEKGLQKRIDRYGIDNLMNQSKREQTIIKKYGSKENFFEQRTLNTIATNQERYGKDWKIQSIAAERSGDLYLDLQNDREKSIEFFNALDHKPSFGELCIMFNCTTYCIYNWIERLNLSAYVQITDTKYESEIIDFLVSVGVDKDTIMHNTRKILSNNQEIDIYLSEYKLGIEMNGNYWHSSLNVKRNYHFNKSKNAEENGITLIHIYQYEWDDPIKRNIIESIIENYLGVSARIFARTCEIRELTDAETFEFLNLNHLQGYRPAKVHLGLFYNNELMQVMTFSKNRKYEWEIIRECTKVNYKIVGGVSKLFKYFIKKYNPKTILSYCDYNKFQGKSYEQLGMSFIGYTGPDMKWLLKNNQVISRHPEKHKEIKAIAAAQIYGAGNKKYLVDFTTC